MNLKGLWDYFKWCTKSLCLAPWTTSIIIRISILIPESNPKHYAYARSVDKLASDESLLAWEDEDGAFCDHQGSIIQKQHALHMSTIYCLLGEISEEYENSKILLLSKLIFHIGRVWLGHYIQEEAAPQIHKGEQIEVLEDDNLPYPEMMERRRVGNNVQFEDKQLLLLMSKATIKNISDNRLNSFHSEMDDWVDIENEQDRRRGRWLLPKGVLWCSYCRWWESWWWKLD